MAGRVAPYVDNTGLVFAYDQSNTVRSYLGEPTTNNYGSNFRDFTGTGYSIDGEWISSEPTRFTKTYFANLPTPIGPGATLIEESGVSGFHHLSRYGGGSESGAHSLSCYLHPQTSGITDFCIGMLGDGSNNIQFNLDTRVITYGGGIQNRNAFIRDVPGWPGWIRVGANIEGRTGGWVGCLGYSSYTSYTGTAGAKKCYITGIQYEYKAYPTQFTTGTRSATQGLKDLTGRSTIDLSNVSFDSNAQMTFDGTDDTLVVSGINLNQNFTLEAIIKMYSRTSFGIFGQGITAQNQGLHILYNHGSRGMIYGMYSNDNDYGGNWIGELNTYYHVVFNYDNSTYNKEFYVNGILQTPASSTETVYSGTGDMRIGMGYSPSVGAAAPAYGDIPIVKIYNRALTASEIQQNFNAVRGRYGI